MAGGLRGVWLAMDEGQVQLEISTSPPLGQLPGEQSAATRDFTPAEYLAHPSCVRFQALGDDAGWRYPSVEISVSVARIRAHHIFDMSQGSGDRPLVEAMATNQQLEMPVRWVNEDVVGAASLNEKTRNAWAEALRRTGGISAAQWKEEVEELWWRQSESWRPGPRPRPYRRRTAEPPRDRSLRFFARRSGSMPKDGPVTIGGIALPKGQRRPDRPAAYWASELPVDGLDSIAPALAARFSETGVWPLLWRSREDPASYMAARGPIDLIEEVDLAAALTELWERHLAPRPARSRHGISEQQRAAALQRRLTRSQLPRSRRQPGFC